MIKLTASSGRGKRLYPSLIYLILPGLHPEFNKQ